jgi:ribosomal protein L21
MVVYIRADSVLTFEDCRSVATKLAAGTNLFAPKTNQEKDRKVKSKEKPKKERPRVKRTPSGSGEETIHKTFGGKDAENRAEERQRAQEKRQRGHKLPATEAKIGNLRAGDAVATL